MVLVSRRSSHNEYNSNTITNNFRPANMVALSRQWGRVPSSLSSVALIIILHILIDLNWNRLSKFQSYIIYVFLLYFIISLFFFQAQLICRGQEGKDCGERCSTNQTKPRREPNQTLQRNTCCLLWYQLTLDSYGQHRFNQIWVIIVIIK